MSLPHLPTSANFHQDIIWHIQEVHQWRVRLMHSLILVWFLSSFQLPKRMMFMSVPFIIGIIIDIQYLGIGCLIAWGIWFIMFVLLLIDRHKRER